MDFLSNVILINFNLDILVFYNFFVLVLAVFYKSFFTGARNITRNVLRKNSKIFIFKYKFIMRQNFEFRPLELFHPLLMRNNVVTR